VTREPVCSIRLPVEGGGLEEYSVHAPLAFARPAGSFTRRALAAAHVVADPLSPREPWLEAAIDWDATVAYRRHLWSWGLGVAEAMDTAQRGMGVDWTSSLELIRRTLEAAQDVPGAFVASGAGTDQLDPDPDLHASDVIAAYEEQCDAIESLGGRIVLMASRALVASARSPDAYGLVYDRVLSQVKQPVIIHWLGEMFDPALEGYWTGEVARRGEVADHAAAMEICLDVIRRNAAKVDGIKLSFLDRDKEIAMRRRLPAGVRMYTGDECNFAELIAGDAEGHSEALLGIFDAIAPAASGALTALAAGDTAAYHDLLAPTVPLSRHIFGAPTRFYKTGVVFMAWLNGHQDHFVMVGGQQSARSILHLAELFRRADAAGLLADPDLACRRMGWLLAVHGID
jgi:hypothetical protein